MKKRKLILVTGGCRSGKSDFAENMLMKMGLPVVYLATAEVTDEEFARRVEAHRRRRPSRWKTVEEPLEIAKIISREARPGYAVLLDSISTWIGNLVWEQGRRKESWASEDERAAQQKVEELENACLGARGTVVLVTEEVGMGVVPAYRQGRVFRDLNGFANRKLAAVADEVYLIVSGLPVKIKSC